MQVSFKTEAPQAEGVDATLLYLRLETVSFVQFAHGIFHVGPFDHAIPTASSDRGKVSGTKPGIHLKKPVSCCVILACFFGVPCSLSSKIFVTISFRDLEILFSCPAGCTRTCAVQQQHHSSSQYVLEIDEAGDSPIISNGGLT